MYAGSSMPRKPIMLTPPGKYLGCTVEQGQLALVGWVVHVCTAGTGTDIRDDFQDVR